MANKALSYMGLAMRAGKLATGEEGVLKAIRTGDAKLVVLAEDAADNAKKKYRDKCDYYHISLVERFTRMELGGSIGKAERVVMAVTDSGLAQMIGKCLENSAEVNGIE